MFSFALESEKWNWLKLDLEALRMFSLFFLVRNNGTHSLYREALTTGAKIVAIVVILYSAYRIGSEILMGSARRKPFRYFENK